MSHLVLLLVLGFPSATRGPLHIALAEAPLSLRVQSCLADASAEASRPGFPFGDNADVDVLVEAGTDQADDPGGEESSEGLVIVPVSIMVDQALHQSHLRGAVPQASRQHCRCLPLRC
jgi:hypothetical protein